METHKPTLGSLFDGIGGFPLAWSALGGAPVWASEIETLPIAVTRRHFPEMTQLGDVAAIHGGAVEPVDLITFGSPCQDLSVAGRRDGLGGERSGLFFEAARIIREMREATHGTSPAFAVWENVPGAFSSNGGEDFHTVLEELARIAEPGLSVPGPPAGGWQPAGTVLGEGWSIAWRVLDAQFWGVPQRRRRIFLVADFGGERAGEILFEREGLPGHPPPGGAARPGAAAPAANGARAAGFNGWRGSTARSIEYAEERAPCLGSNGHPPELVAAFKGGQGSKAGGIGYSEAAAPTLTAAGSGTNLAPCCMEVWPRINDTLLARHDSSTRPDQINNICCVSTGQANAEILEDMAPTLHCDHEEPYIAGETLVRRLTPTECERLQGFPDGWTAWGLDGSRQKRRLADAPRYRALGNSIAIPCATYVLAGVMMELERRLSG